MSSKMEGTLVSLRPEHFELFRALYESTLEWMTASCEVSVLDYEAALLDVNSVWKVYESSVGLGPIGLAGFHSINRIDRSADPLVALAPSNQRQGLGLKMGHALAKFGFDTLNLRRLHTKVLADAPSRRLLEKLGFTHEATFSNARFRNGVYEDVLAYRLFKEEYKCHRQ